LNQVLFKLLPGLFGDDLLLEETGDAIKEAPSLVLNSLV
jgi:hypothetical protein